MKGGVSDTNEKKEVDACAEYSKDKQGRIMFDDTKAFFKDDGTIGAANSHCGFLVTCSDLILYIMAILVECLLDFRVISATVSVLMRGSMLCNI